MERAISFLGLFVMISLAWLMSSHKTRFPWRVVVGVANSGWLPTTVSTKARQEDLVRPILADLVGDVEVLDGAARRTLGQLAGSSAARFTDGARSTPDRATCSWLVSARSGTTITICVQHQRAGSDSVELVLSPG